MTTGVDDEPVIIAEYSSQWPAQFEEEAHVLREIFSPENVDLEHIGSTLVRRA